MDQVTTTERGATGSGAESVARLRILLVVSRPRFWLYLAGPVFVGLAYGAESVTSLASPAAIALIAYFLLPANVFLYGVNDVFDAEADRMNPRKGTVETRFRGEPVVVASTLAGAGLGLVLALVLGGSAGWLLVAFLVLGTAYSAPPLRLKGRPPLDSLSNGLYVLPGVAAFVAVAGALPPALALLGGWCWTMAMHTFSAIPDVEADRLAGIDTTATALGARGAMAYCAACWLVAAAAFGALDSRLGVLMLGYPALVAGIVGSPLDVGRAYRWFPAVNAVVGMAITLGGLWGLVHG